MVGIELVQRIEQRLDIRPHSPLENPELTEEAEGLTGTLDNILTRGKLSLREKMLQTEALLLSKWRYAQEWKDYLDSPLITHADAAMSLKNSYDAVVGIQKAGIAYAKIFELMGFPVYDIDFSHHKRNMEKPVMDQKQIAELKGKRNVLLTDIDFVTGRTLREVTNYLRERGINVTGAYIGLSKWQGLESNNHYIGDDTVNFETFWKTCGNTRQIMDILPYKKKIIPHDLRIYTSNKADPNLNCYEMMSSGKAVRIAKYIKKSEAK